MLTALSQSWALFLGMFFLMVGNGLQGTLLGIRGGIEGFSTIELSFIMSGYFAGFLGGSHLAPELIRRVGHVRVFAALASLISAVMILYPVMPDPWVWVLLRVVFGFCMCRVYVTAESWLNSSTSNATRGQTLSVYLVVQMAGITSAQVLPMLGDPSGFVLFVIPSVLVSIAFAPILLSVTPVPPFATTRPMGLRRLFRISPLGCVGVFLMGGVYAALFGMASVYGTAAGLDARRISLFVAAIYLGGLVAQFPVGWLSDRMDRRKLILIVAAGGALASGTAMLPGVGYPGLLAAGFAIGMASNPLYGLLLAHTNDFLKPEDMAAASGLLLFLNGASAVVGPVVTGIAMDLAGPSGFFLHLLVLMASVAVYAGWRMTRRPPVPVAETGEFTPILPTASRVTVEAAQEPYIQSAGIAEAAVSDMPQTVPDDRRATG